MFENGSIVEMGNFNDLLAKKGKFIHFLKSFNDLKEISQDFSSNLLKNEKNLKSKFLKN